ncbi:MAG: CvpA family protein [Epsilonproteobacteria bacterium]|nr:CvpA family protein [Campylobacterota bacterium]
MDFNIFDVVILCITLILGIKGYVTGIIREIAGLVGIGAGLFFATAYYHKAGEYINSSIFKIANESAINVVGFVAVFVLVWFGVLLVGMMFSKILQVARLGLIDRIGGMIFGAGKFFIIVSVIVTMLSNIDMLQSRLAKYQKDSILWPIMQKVGEKLIHFKPDDLQKKIEDVKQKVNDKITTQIQQDIQQNIQKVGENLVNSLNNKGE